MCFRRLGWTEGLAAIGFWVTDTHASQEASKIPSLRFALLFSPQLCHHEPSTSPSPAPSSKRSPRSSRASLAIPASFCLSFRPLPIYLFWTSSRPAQCPKRSDLVRGDAIRFGGNALLLHEQGISWAPQFAGEEPNADDHLNPENYQNNIHAPCNVYSVPCGCPPPLLLPSPPPPPAPPLPAMGECDCQAIQAFSVLLCCAKSNPIAEHSPLMLIVKPDTYANTPQEVPKVLYKGCLGHAPRKPSQESVRRGINCS